jgi:hypothetical protein
MDVVEGVDVRPLDGFLNVVPRTSVGDGRVNVRASLRLLSIGAACPPNTPPGGVALRHAVQAPVASATTVAVCSSVATSTHSSVPWRFPASGP